jgi:DNA-binding protein WhiA
MTFSLSTKNELARVFPEGACCARAELAAIASLDGKWGKDGKLEVTSSNAAAARKVYTLLKKLYRTENQVAARKKRRLDKKNLYVVSAQGVQQLVDDPLAQPDTDALPSKRCCRRSFLRGAFLARGSATNPNRGYHLEFWTSSKREAERIVGCLESFGIAAGISTRKRGLVVYLKEGEKIAHLLSLMGAHRALLRFENVRIMKGMRGQVNRLVNCETANMDKTVQAAMKQVAQIRKIQEKIGLDKLPPKLRDLALLRLEHPYATFAELGELLTPRVTKSGVSYRMGRLAKIAEDLGEG